MPLRNQPHQCSVSEAFIDGCDDTSLVTAIFHEPKSRANGDLANHIESIELHHLSDVQYFPLLCILFQPLEQDGVACVDEWLVRKQCRLGIELCHWAPGLSMGCYARLGEYVVFVWWTEGIVELGLVHDIVV